MVNSVNVKSSLCIKYHFGQDEQGKKVYKNQTLNNISTLAGDEDIFEVAKSLASLLPDSEVEVFRKNNNLLASA